MKRNAPAAVELEAYFSVLLHTSQTSGSGWLDRLGFYVCSFNVQQRSRTKYHQGLNKETASLTCFPQTFLTKNTFAISDFWVDCYIYEEHMDDITVQTHWVAVGWIVLYLPVVEAETSSQTFHLTESPPLVAKISGHKNNLSASLKSLMDLDKTAQERTRFIL